MAVYKLRCEIEYPDTPGGLETGNDVIDAVLASQPMSLAGSVDLHLCRHDEDPLLPCESPVRSASWGGDLHA